MRAENDFSLVWGSIYFVFVRVVEIDMVLVCWPKSLNYSGSIEIYFVCVWLVEIDLILMWGIEADLISV